MSVYDLEQLVTVHYIDNFDINQNFDRKLYTLVTHLSTKKLAQMRQPVNHSCITSNYTGFTAS